MFTTVKAKPAYKKTCDRLRVVRMTKKCDTAVCCIRRRCNHFLESESPRLAGYGRHARLRSVAAVVFGCLHGAASAAASCCYMPIATDCCSATTVAAFFQVVVFVQCCGPNSVSGQTSKRIDSLLLYTIHVYKSIYFIFLCIRRRRITFNAHNKSSEWVGVETKVAFKG